MFAAAAQKSDRVLARTLLFGTSALLAAGLLTWTPSAVTGWNQGAAEGTLWQLLNGARVNNGMAPLQQHGTLVGLARWRSGDMLARNYFSHTIPGCGCPVYPYYDQNGLNYVWGGENIGWNSGLTDDQSPFSVHERFMASPGHRANVLHAAFTHGGVGAAAADNQMYQGYVQNTRMYTELFMQAGGAAPPPPAARPAPRAAPAPAGPGYAPAQAAPVAAAPAEPTAAAMSVAAPRRPSSPEVDGSAEAVSAAAADKPTRSLAADVSTARLGALDKAPASQADAEPGFAVEAAPSEDRGFLGDLVAAFFGFVFG